ncbi:hypothetical protein SGCOL_011833 [Colletotrichum sp. CLE4]
MFVVFMIVKVFERSIHPRLILLESQALQEASSNMEQLLLASVEATPDEAMKPSSTNGGERYGVALQGKMAHLADDELTGVRQVQIEGLSVGPLEPATEKTVGFIDVTPVDDDVVLIDGVADFAWDREQL